LHHNLAWETGDLVSLKPGIEIVIMAHDRQVETLRAVDAIKKIDFGVPTYITVSDNPTSKELIVTGLPADIKHVIRDPCMTANEHAKTIWGEFESEWTLLTHDDDELLPALGRIFIQFSGNPDVSVITGLSEIINKDGNTIQEIGYESRLASAGLFQKLSEPRFDLAEHLFDLGSLFPASAIIIRGNHGIDFANWNVDFELAGDLAHSMYAALEGAVVFEGREPVMKYHLHGGNSVLTSGAAGGLMADFTVTRLQFLMDNPEWATAARKLKITKGALIGRILANAFHLDKRYRNIAKYVHQANKATGNAAAFSICLIPLPLGVLKPLVRFLMWRRLGVRRVRL
jgi:hypothetical protein